MKIGIAGLGLIGGSLAKSIAQRTEHTLYAIDTDEETMRAASGDGVIRNVLTDEVLETCDLLLLALRPGAAVRYVQEHAAHMAKTVIDCCGVKRVVSEALLPLAKAHGFRYVGGHPMAGKEKGGYVNARADLFDGASMILVPHEGGAEEWSSFFLSLGFGRIQISDDETHDRILAYTSQLAHVVSNSFAKSETSRIHHGYSANSLQDLTRVATLDEEMWTELFLDNKDYLSAELTRIIDDLQRYRNALQSGDAQTLKKELRKGCEAKARMLEEPATSQKGAHHA